MIEGLVLKYLHGECFVIRRGYETALTISAKFNLTVLAHLIERFIKLNSGIARVCISKIDILAGSLKSTIY